MGTLKIKKVDDKPMVIHTKKKAKIHMHEPKKAKIKGSNIYTVQRGPKIASAKINDTGKKKSYRKSTIHQAEKKEKEPSKFKRNIRESNTSIKTKNTNLHIAGRTGALAAGAVTEQVEGGQEVSQAAYLAYEVSRPVTGTASRGASLFRRKAAAEAKRRIKKVETGKKLAKKMGKKAASETAKKVAGDTTKTAAKETAKNTAKETAKNTAKETAKTTAKAATTAAGTAVAPGAGIAVGMAAGYATGVSIEAKDVKAANRSRKIKFFLDKMKEQENQTDSVVKLVKDLIVKKAVLWIKAAAPIIGLVLLLLVLLVVIVAVPVIAVIAILYNSPFALFLPPLESGDTVQTVTSAYVSEFNRDVNTKVNEHTGYDFGELVYVDYEGMDENPSNYYDIMAVYMVKYGVGDTATIMNDISKGWLQTVVNDMCSYTTSSGTKDVEETDADGNVTTVTKSVLYVNVTLKSYRDMISVYGFNSDQVEMLEQIMSPEFMGQLGYAGSGSGGGGGSPGVSSMTEDEINAILSGITDSRQKAVCSYALHRVGYPYSQELRDSGNYYDCSSLAYYSWKDADVNISYGGATTAAAEAQGLDEAGKTVSYDEMQPGDLIFYSFTNNGRYKNISHVAVYVGNGKVVEALNERVGVVYRDVASDEMFDEVNKMLRVEARGIEKSTKKRKKNLFICPYCGRKLMNSSAVCTPKLLCPKRRMVRTGECQQIFMLKSEAQDKVLEITKEICRTLIQEEELKRASKDKRKVTSDEYLISELKAEYDRISNSTVSCYQSYREGKYTKEEYVQLRKTNQELLADLENQISDLQEKAANQEPDTEEKIEQLTQYSMLEQYDGDVLSNIIDKVLIYNDKDIEVVFKGENFIRNAV